MKFTLRIDGIDLEPENQAERDIVESWQYRAASCNCAFIINRPESGPDRAMVRFEKSA